MLSSTISKKLDCSYRLCNKLSKPPLETQTLKITNVKHLSWSVEAPYSSLYLNVTNVFLTIQFYFVCAGLCMHSFSFKMQEVYKCQMPVHLSMCVKKFLLYSILYSILHPHRFTYMKHESNSWSILQERRCNFKIPI